MISKTVNPVSRLGAVALSAALVLCGATARAQSDEENPYTQPDGTWISLSGTVQSISADTFTLDYGPSVVTV